MTVLRAPRPAGLVLSPDDSAATAAHAVLRFHLRAFAGAEPAARAGEIEPVHQLRVATRRLRAALGAANGGTAKASPISGRDRSPDT